MPRTTVVSAPGKVLLAGGYLVLDRLYSGLVVATSSRFYCCVSQNSSSSSTSGDSLASSSITVRAGQFPSASSTWTYDISLRASSPTSPTPTLQVSQSNTEKVGSNKFVQITLAKTLELAWETLCQGDQGEEAVLAAGRELLKRLGGDNGLRVTVLGDNDFYSQREQLRAASLPPLISSLDALTPFCPLPRPLSKVNKTGLGSSAALVTSLVAGLLSHLDIVDVSARLGKDLVHSLAQFAHCLAQGKVGSGFDVASAVYGTHIYRRFSPSILASHMQETSHDISLFQPSLMDSLNPVVWDHQCSSFRLPKGIRLMLADVDAGTDTPSFVGKVLAWRKEQPEAGEFRGLTKLIGSVGFVDEAFRREHRSGGYVSSSDKARA